MYLLARKSFMNWFNRSAFWRLEGSVDQAAPPETRMDLGTLDDRSPVVAEVRVCRRDWPNRLQVSAIIEALQGIARNRIGRAGTSQVGQSLRFHHGAAARTSRRWRFRSCAGLLR
jgi:hypothetical protein